ncbi:restriction endonuclease subunit S [Empedobacter sp. ULE_I136]
MDLVSIETIAFIADGNYSSKYPRNEEFISEGVPFIRANNFENSTISDKDMLFISEEKHSTITKGHLKYNDVLITTRGNIGKTALVPKKHENSNINAQIVLLRCKENCYPKYLMHCFSIPFVKNQLDNNTTGTALKQLSVGNLRKIQIPLPPLETQKAIVEKLDKADALRKKDHELLKLYDDLAQAIFIDMFGDPVQNEKGWKRDIGENLYKVKGRVGWKGYKKTDLRQSGALVLGATHIDNFGYVDLSKPIYLSDEKFDESPEIIISQNDLIFVQRGNTIGKVGLIRDFIGRATINPVVVILTPNISPYFLLYLLLNNSVKNKILEINSGSAQPMITQKSMKEFVFINPPLELQNQFAEKIKNIEAQKAIVKQQAEESENLFQALLQQSFNFN